MAETSFEPRIQQQPHQHTKHYHHDKPHHGHGSYVRDSGFQDSTIDIAALNGHLEAAKFLEKSLINDEKNTLKNDNSKSNDSSGMLDPWGNTNKDQEDDFTKSIKFNKSLPPTPAASDDDGMENNFNQFSEMLNTTTNLPTITEDSMLIDGLEDERVIMLKKSISEEEKKVEINKIFSSAVSNGNTERVSKMLENARSYIDIDAQDEDGITPLIYAACFGHNSVAYTLIEAGAKVDSQDRNGWTPLMWATNNNHGSTIQILLDSGADAGAKSAKGHTVFNFVPPDNHKIADIFIHNPKRESWSSNESIGGWYMVGDAENRLEESLAEAERKSRMLIESSLNLEIDLESLGIDDPENTEEEETPYEFVWEHCLPDQMFVFSSEDIPHILHTVITDMQPIRSKAQKPVPANVLFLSARFAHYFSSPELLEELLYGIIDTIDMVVRSKPDDMTLQSFWISNCTLLYYYLKKDSGLAKSTVEYQIRFAELIHEIFVMLVRDAERRFDKILEASMLDFETIPLDDVRFEGEWRVFRSLTRRSHSPSSNTVYPVKPTSQLRRSSSTSGVPSSNRTAPPSPRQRSHPSPRNVTSLLSSTLFILQTYELHPSIVEQVISQLYYYISSELFNRILAKKKYICRSKAMQIRLNVSTLEDWARTNNLSTNTSSHCQPLVQLLQLLQCWSQMADFTMMVQTTKELHLINPAQLKRVMKNYRYEVKEARLPEECQQYIQQLEEDHERRRKRNSTESIRSVYSESSIYLIGNGSPTNSNGGSGWEEEEDLMETKDSKMLLPFAIPTSTEMLANYGGKEKAAEFVPVVLDEWMEKLDVGMRHGTSSAVEELTSQWELTYNEDEDDEDSDDGQTIGADRQSLEIV
ncbi:6318_t:CDS:2 [Ambispora gerdemannii]|uniref:6318_t:CDS:1 n=1 Tax=Ambispora gerdemannii TaxID=144530 RepID=A0A9N8YJP8_9GLOM|nr:6318_t:CDS:2 [Ambispora gerdemannii]